MFTKVHAEMSRTFDIWVSFFCKKITYYTIKRGTCDDWFSLTWQRCSSFIIFSFNYICILIEK